MDEANRKRRLLEAKILIPNLLLVGGVLVYLAVTRLDSEKVANLVDVDPATKARIEGLEKALLRNPSDVGKSIELARLYSDAGEFPWSYNALKNAERGGGHDPTWRMRLGMAYLELGKNEDGVRILEEALERCSEIKCEPPVRIKLDLFARVARKLLERKIDTRKDEAAAQRALQEVLKPVHADPEKMRPKAPATAPAELPPAVPAPAPKG